MNITINWWLFNIHSKLLLFHSIPFFFLISDLVRRPVVMVGPLWEIVCDKLVHDYPHNFTRCVPEVSWLSCDEMETAVQKNLIVDYRRRGSHFEATTVSQVKEICDKVNQCWGTCVLEWVSVYKSECVWERECVWVGMSVWVYMRVCKCASA